MKWRICICLLFVYNIVSAQTSDLILLKKGKFTVASYFKGSKIEISTINGVHLIADITTIRNDSIFLQEFIIRQIPTRLGVYVLDTVGSYRFQYHYKEIKCVYKQGRHFNLGASGASLLGGGVLLVLGSGVVYLADRDKFSPQLMLSGAALGAAGYAMLKHNSNAMKIGNKFRLEYIDVSNNKTE